MQGWDDLLRRENQARRGVVDSHLAVGRRIYSCRHGKGMHAHDRLVSRVLGSRANELYTPTQRGTRTYLSTQLRYSHTVLYASRHSLGRGWIAQQSIEYY